MFVVASQTLDTLAALLNDPNIQTLKVVVQCLTTVYPLLFRSLCVVILTGYPLAHVPPERCTNRNSRAQWDTLTFCKSRILEFVWTSEVNVGVKLSAIKFLQRVILVQTRGVSDPRVVVKFTSKRTLPLTTYVRMCNTASEQKRSKSVIMPGGPSVHLSDSPGSRGNEVVGERHHDALH
jgi:hypothetical protein